MTYFCPRDGAPLEDAGDGMWCHGCGETLTYAAALAEVEDL